MTRARRPGDWEHDLAASRAIEAAVHEALLHDDRLSQLTDMTNAVNALDFSFVYRGRSIALDVKEKRQRYSTGIRALRPAVGEPDLFVVDETVYRRIVWQGGGGFLAIHDLPGRRWCYFGPWELTLGERVRYGRWGQRGTKPFLKGKLLMELSTAAASTPQFDIPSLLSIVDASMAWRDRPEPYPIHGARLRELGGEHDQGR